MSGEFVWRMEEVLKAYAEPHDPARPLVCFDEAGKELHAERHEPKPGAALPPHSPNPPLNMWTANYRPSFPLWKNAAAVSASFVRITAPLMARTVTRAIGWRIR